MECQFSAFLLLLIPFLSLFFLLLRLAKPGNKANKIQIPGPWKLPVLGNLHQLAAARSSLPHHAFHELSLKHGALMHLQLGELFTVTVSSPDMAKEIMKTRDLPFVQRPCFCSAKILAYGATDIAFAPYGDYWRQMRKICTLELVSKLIESVESSVGSELDLTAKIYPLTSSVVMRVAFRDKRKDGEELVRLLHEIVKQLGGFHFADLFPSIELIHLMTGMEARLWNIHKKFDKVLENILQENLKNHMKAAEGGHESDLAAAEENLVQILSRIQRSESFDVSITINHVKAVIWDMFAGGIDTSGSVLEWAISEMMRTPRVMKKGHLKEIQITGMMLRGLYRRGSNKKEILVLISEEQTLSTSLLEQEEECVLEFHLV